jgi:sialate O-acetylesterase
MKKEVGQRLASYVIADNYGKTSTSYKSPLYKSMKIEKNKIRVFFENADQGLTTTTGAPRDFYIAGEDKKFVPAQAKIENSTVVVSSKLVRNPVAVRFGFTNHAMPNLFSKQGLPVNTFRTDDWNVNTEPEKK